MIEVRAAMEMRAAEGRTLVGRAAVWDRPTRIGGPGGFMEVVRRGAFEAHLATGADIFLLAHHDFAQPLARRGNSSLKLQEDDTGLSFEASLPQTRAADDILELARSGTIAGASIGFRIPAGGDVWAKNVRELRRIELIEVSAVTSPAYGETSISARARLSATASKASLRLLLIGL